MTRTDTVERFGKTVITSRTTGPIAVRVTLWNPAWLRRSWPVDTTGSVDIYAGVETVVRNYDPHAR